MAKFSSWLSADGLTLLRGWARDGLTDADIAHNCGVSRETLHQWRKRFPDISDTLKEGKEIADIPIENSLYKRALGYDYTEQSTEESEKNGITTKTFHKHMPADVTACIYWLKNRKREVWKESHDKYEIDQERLEMDKRKLEAELKDKDGGDKTIMITLAPELEELAY